MRGTKTNILKKFISIGIYVLILFIMTTASALSKPYWEGKKLMVLCGSAPGGGYDAYSRLVARHLPKQLPGKPLAIVKNLPAGRGVGMVNELYRTKPDGLTIAMLNRALPVQQLVGLPGLRFDVTKLSWLASATSSETLFFVGTKKGWNSFDDIIQSGQTVNVAASGVGYSPYQYQKALELAFGLKINIVHYGGTGERMLAVERGEVDGGTLDIEAFMSGFKHFLDRKVVKIIAQTGPNRNPLFPDVQTVPELLEKFPTDPQGAALMNAFLKSTIIGRPFGAPPGFSKGLLATLREAFEKAFADPDLLAEAKKMRLVINPIPGKELEKMVADFMKSPPEVVRLFKEMFPSSKKKI